MVMLQLLPVRICDLGVV